MSFLRSLFDLFGEFGKFFEDGFECVAVEAVEGAKIQGFDAGDARSVIEKSDFAKKTSFSDNGVDFIFFGGDFDAPVVNEIHFFADFPFPENVVARHVDDRFHVLHEFVKDGFVGIAEDGDFFDNVFVER